MRISAILPEYKICRLYPGTGKLPVCFFYRIFAVVKLSSEHTTVNYFPLWNGVPLCTTKKLAHYTITHHTLHTTPLHTTSHHTTTHYTLHTTTHSTTTHNTLHTTHHTLHHTNHPIETGLSYLMFDGSYVLYGMLFTYQFFYTFAPPHYLHYTTHCTTLHTTHYTTHTHTHRFPLKLGRTRTIGSNIGARKARTTAPERY